jgi:hypothetical protein
MTYLPATQGVQLPSLSAATVVENFPAAQSMQAPVVPCGVCLPAVQSLQSVAASPSSSIFPAGQAEQLVAPVCVKVAALLIITPVKVPAAHLG